MGILIGRENPTDITEAHEDVKITSSGQVVQSEESGIVGLGEEQTPQVDNNEESKPSVKRGRGRKKKGGR